MAASSKIDCWRGRLQEYLAGQLVVLFPKNGAGAKPIRAEAAHRQRVASRRLQAGFDFFPDFFHRAGLRRNLRELRRMRRALACIRTIDAHRALLADRAHRWPTAARQARQQAAAWLARARAEEVRDFGRLLQTIKTRRGSQRLRQLIIQMRRDVRAAQLVRSAAAQLERQRRALIRCGRRFKKTKSNRAFHEFRIALKKVRYAMEACQAVFDLDLSQDLETLRRWQHWMGLIRDYETLARCLRQLQKENTAAIPRRGTRELRRACKEKMARQLDRFQKQLNKKPIRLEAVPFDCHAS